MSSICSFSSSKVRLERIGAFVNISISMPKNTEHGIVPALLFCAKLLLAEGIKLHKEGKQ